ncbi:MAG: methylornithine synthase PylB [Desulfobacter sp.]|nr:MAG: methylornithine synthase PylB [Desulfobacter sp.]
MPLDLSPLLARLEKEAPARKKEIRFLLGLTTPEDLGRLFDAAARVRDRHFGSRIFFYGFLYFSTYCRNNCRFCQYRRSNRAQPRYRKTEAQIMEAAAIMADSGVHLIDLTMGEDPVWQGMDGIRRLTDLAVQVQQKTGLPVMISPGMLSPSGVSHMAARGIHWYACYQETHNRALFDRLRPGQDYDDRWAAKTAAREAGMLIEEGILAGVGETLEDIADSILAMAALNVDQARVMSFVPQPGTPMAHLASRNRLRELTTIAVMRLVLKDCLIPASLDVDGLDGLLPRLNAGANVVTSIVPPEHGLAGVANPALDIEAARRSLDHVLPVLDRSGLSPASETEYRDWIQARRHLCLARTPN